MHPDHAIEARATRVGTAEPPATCPLAPHGHGQADLMACDPNHDSRPVVLNQRSANAERLLALARLNVIPGAPPDTRDERWRSSWEAFRATRLKRAVHAGRKVSRRGDIRCT